MTGPLAFEVNFRRSSDQQLLSVRTESAEKANHLYERLLESGEYPSLYLGGMLVREEPDDPAATNRRRLNELRSNEGPLSKIRVGVVS